MTRAFLPILNYHGIEARPGQYSWLEEETPYVVARQAFSAQLRLLKGLGFESLASAKLEDWFKSPAPRKFMVTLDDGHLSHYEEAAPCLKENGMTALFFIPAALIGQKGQMSWLQIRELVAAGFQIGSHGLNHIALTDLPDEGIYEELGESKKRLEDKLGVSVETLSIPRGYYHPRIRRIAQAVGYRYVFTSDFDINTPSSDALNLKRMAVLKATSETELARRVQGDLGMCRIVEKAKTTLRSVVPSSVYDGFAKTKRRVLGMRKRGNL